MRKSPPTDGGEWAESEAAALTDHIHAQQIRHWITAHRLEACHACTGFRIDELGLADVISSPGFDRSQHYGRTGEPGPLFATAGTWRR